MKYIITESQDYKLWIIRRVPKFMEILKDIPPYKFPCEIVKREVQYIELVKDWFLDTLVDEVEGVDSDNTNIIWEIIMSVNGDEIKNNFTKKCKKKK